MALQSGLKALDELKAGVVLYNKTITSLHALHQKQYNLLPTMTKAQLGMMRSPGNHLTTAEATKVPDLALFCHWSPTTSMNIIRNPSQEVMADGLNASTQVVQTLFQGRTVLIVQVCPLKQVGKSYDKPVPAIFELVKPPLEKLIALARKHIHVMFTICPNSRAAISRIISQQLEMKSETILSDGGATYARISNVHIVSPTEHFGNWVDTRRPILQVLTSLNTSLSLFQEAMRLIGAQPFDQQPLVTHVQSLERSKAGRLFDGLTMSNVARKRKAREPLTDVELLEYDRMKKLGKLQSTLFLLRTAYV